MAMPLRRSGLSLKRLRRHPHGLVLGDQIATGVLRRKLRTPGRRIRPPEIAGELKRIRSANGSDPDHPLLLIGMRELRSHNSWMHNAPLLMRGGRVQALRVHPDDAAALGLEDGAGARVESKSGAVQVPVKITDEMTPGTVALPHGWGHRGGWRLANEHAGANVNLLSSSDPDDLERLAGMAHLNGIPVRVSPVAAAAPATAPARAAAP
jgi:anaerobic selenocysteine-containing dehydrogenase